MLAQTAILKPVSVKKIMGYRYAVFIDLVAFKAINDRFNHDLGDQLLIAFAEFLKRSVALLKKEVWGFEFCANRCGGDEFVVFAIPMKEKWDIWGHGKAKGLEECLEAWGSDLAKRWQETVWRVSYPILQNQNEDEYEEDVLSEAEWVKHEENAYDAQDSRQKILVKGLKLRFGVGETIIQAEKNSKDEKDEERGVINSECMIAFPESAHHEIEGPEWFKLKEHMIYVCEKSDLKAACDCVQEVEKSVLSGSKITKQAQQDAVFFVLPMEYDRYNEKVMSIMERIVKEESKAGKSFDIRMEYISWIHYAANFKDRVNKVLKQNNNASAFWCLSGRKIKIKR